MEPQASFDIPLESLALGEHEFRFELDDEFFAAFETELLRRGRFDVRLAVEKIRSQVDLRLQFEGAAGVECDRCLEPFALPLAGEESFVVKYDPERADDDGDVIYVPYGTERLNVAKLIFDSIGLALPMAITHDAAGLTCDPSMTRFLGDGEGNADADSDGDAEPAEESSERSGSESTDTTEIPADSPWRALEALRGTINPN